VVAVVNHGAGGQRVKLESPAHLAARLTSLPNIINSPSFSPNGRQLAFTAQSLDMTTWAIYILSLDDATLPLSSLDAPGVRRLTPDGMLGQAPVWSPDGAWLAYSGNPAGIVFPTIYVSAVDGSSTVQVSAVNRFPDNSPAWSPDGHRLAYVAEDGGHFNISLVNPDGTGLISLTASAGSSDNSIRSVEFQEPSWRP
jgi:TolB protein